MEFQSTPSVRRETEKNDWDDYAYDDFNPLPPCGGRQRHGRSLNPNTGFQSTPSVRRETVQQWLWLSQTEQFQSTPSVRRETASPSILAPQLGQFQSTPSVRRETKKIDDYAAAIGQFQSTPSVRRETVNRVQGISLANDFNPLPPCGGRRCIHWVTLTYAEFQSTPSVRRETYITVLKVVLLIFQSTPSVRRETEKKPRK